MNKQETMKTLMEEAMQEMSFDDVMTFMEAFANFENNISTMEDISNLNGRNKELFSMGFDCALSTVCVLIENMAKAYNKDVKELAKTMSTFIIEVNTEHPEK